MRAKRYGTARKEGFSLVEVSLAIVVVGLGLIVVFALFPSSLRSSEDAVADTKSTLFAEYVFNTMSANAAAVPTWVEWSSPSLPADLVHGAAVIPNGTVREAQFPGADDWLQYRLTVNTAGDVKTAVLETRDGKAGAFSAQAVYYAEFFYRGM